MIILEKNCLRNLNFFLKELASHIFYFSIFRFRNLTCDVTAWTILTRVFERSTGSAFWTFNCCFFESIIISNLFMYFLSKNILLLLHDVILFWIKTFDVFWADTYNAIICFRKYTTFHVFPDGTNYRKV